MNKVHVEDILNSKGSKKIVMLTCYDYSFARILDEADVDIILVGDSLANVVLGLSETRRVSLKEMLNHTRAVAGAVKRALVVADMPYVSYQKDPQRCLRHAKEFLAAGAAAVKIEWFRHCPYVVERLVKSNIPVMGHIGLTPQTAHLLGGYKVQGRDKETAEKLLKQATYLQELGVFSIVLECMPYEISRRITRQLTVPTIGIGAGKFCDGQVLVLYDLLGLYKERKPKFVRVYKDLSAEVKDCLRWFARDVRQATFPSSKESFSLKPQK
jgi:3-methyl-2-oxobutanoate hydroxymethyltransferase